MDLNKVINDSILELKSNPKVYVMFKDLSSFKSFDEHSDEFRKLKYALVRSEPFEKHTDFALRLSTIGLKIVNEFDGNWYRYKESLKPKKDIFKIISAITSIISLILLVLTFIINNKSRNLEKVVETQKVTIDSLKKHTTLKPNSIK